MQNPAPSAAGTAAAVVAFTEASAADAKRWSVPPMVLADLRPTPVQVYHLQQSLEPRLAKVETDVTAATAANTANAAMIGAMLSAQAAEAKVQRDALERRFEELLRAQAMEAKARTDALEQRIGEQMRAKGAAFQATIEAIRAEARQLARDNATLRDELQCDAKAKAATIAALQTENAELKRQLNARACHPRRSTMRPRAGWTKRPISWPWPWPAGRRSPYSPPTQSLSRSGCTSPSRRTPIRMRCWKWRCG
jgi:hypothetical protein